MTFRDRWIATTLVLMVTGACTSLAAANDKFAYSGLSTQLTQLDNGLVIEGQDVDTPDRHTSGFSLTAGFTPPNMPALDLGAELSYHDSDNVPRSGSQNMLIDTTSLGGNLIAGIRLEDGIGLYAKSGLASWDGQAVTGNAALPDGGTTHVGGFGARWKHSRLISQIEYEHFDDPALVHLNMVTASVRIPF